MAVMVVTTVCGAMIGYNLHVDDQGLHRLIFGLYAGAIGAVVGVPIWVWLGYMVLRNKTQHPIKLYQTTPPLKLSRIVVRR